MMISPMLDDLISRSRDVDRQHTHHFRRKRPIFNSFSPSLIITSFLELTVHPSTPNPLTALATSSAPCALVNKRRGRMIEKFVLPISWNTVPPPERRLMRGIFHLMRSRGVVSFHGFWYQLELKKWAHLITTYDYAWCISIYEQDRLITRCIS
jgi:hypothetical protein